MQYSNGQLRTTPPLPRDRGLNIPRDMVFSFNANGQDYSVEVKPNMPLVFVLRDLLGRQAVTIGCGRNTSCGACIIRLDGERRNSCSILVEQVQGCTITTPGYVPDPPAV